VCAIAGLAYWRVSISSESQISSLGVLNKPKSFSFNAVGDFSSGSNADLVLRKVGESGSDFTLALGDLSYAGNGTEQAWCQFVIDRVGAEHPFELVSGNHDDGDSDGDIMEYRKCLPDKLGTIKGDYGIEYFFDYENIARFILISPDIDNYGFDYTRGSAHYNWLAETIDSAATTNIDWVIVGMHKNCITAGVKSCEIGEDLLNLLVEKKVDLILQGHEHAYMRSKQLGLSAGCPTITINGTDQDCIVGEGSDFAKGAGSLITISGAGGYELREINLNDSEIGYFDAWNGSNVSNSYGFAKFEVSAQKIKAEFVAAIGDFQDSYQLSQR